ncbi:MAG: ribosome maturation factor RimM [Tannerella sp.]|jgi:16S rRNA processing protein RimM|nr:ribosome maturation factor RimM [Tannerella sp.]
MIRAEDLFQIGQFARPHGIKGELSLVTDYDVFDDTEDPYIVCEMEGILVPFYIESYRPKGRSTILVKLEQVDDDRAAKQFTNRAVYYPLTAWKQPPEETMTWNHFAGYMLEDEKQGEIGRVKDVDTTTINVLFRVDYRGKERLLPVAEALIRSVDRAEKRIVLSLPEGILDI